MPVYPGSAYLADYVSEISVLGWWKLDETSGTSYLDSSGNGKTLTATGSVTPNQTAISSDPSGSNKAVDFSGGYLSRSGDSDFQLLVNSWSVGAWINWDSFTDDTYVIGMQYSGFNNNFGIVHNRDSSWGTGKFGVAFYNAAWREAYYNVALTAGVTYFLCGTWDGTNLRFYVNGVLQATNTPSVAPNTSTGSLYVGRYWGGATNPVDGRIDDLFVTSGALGGAEIAAIYADANALSSFIVSTSSDATVTPSTVAATSAVPSPVIAVRTSTVEAAAAMPSPSISTGATVAPGAAAAFGGVPAPSVTGNLNATVTASLVAAYAGVPDPSVLVEIPAAAVVATSSVPAPTVEAEGGVLVYPDEVAATGAVPTPTLSGSFSASLVPGVVRARASVPTPEGVSASSVTINALVVAAEADVPFSDHGAPPGPVTGVTITPLDGYSIELDWTNPTDPDALYVLIMRRNGLPYAIPTDLEASNNDITWWLRYIVNAEAYAATPINTAVFSDMQNTVNRPLTGPRSSPGAWYVYTPADSGMITLSTARVRYGFDTYITVYEDTLDNEIASDDDSGYYKDSYLETAVSVGHTYYIVVQGYASGDPDYVGDLYFDFTGPEPVIMPAVTGGSLIDSGPDDVFNSNGLVPGQDYYYSIYTYDWAGNVSDVDYVAVTATTESITAPDPIGAEVGMLPGTVTILAGTPVEPGVGEDINFYGVPFRVSLSEPTGVYWLVNLINPPPIRPGTLGSFPPNLIDPAEVRTPTDITVELWDQTNTTKIADLDYSAARQFLDEYNGVGSGTLQVPSTHPSSSLLKRDRVLRFHYRDIPDAVFASVIEGRKTAVVTDPGSHWTSVTGRGTLCWLEDAVVLPYVDPADTLPITGQRVLADGSTTKIQSNLQDNSADVRAFNFGSRDAPYHSLFNDEGPGSRGYGTGLNSYWTTPVGVSFAARNDDLKGYPINWPDPAAMWIWKTNPTLAVKDGLQAWFRGDFVLSADETVNLYFASDNYATVYIDGVKIDYTATWSTFRRVTLTLSAGQHQLQVAAKNQFAPALKPNHAGFIATIKRVSDGAVLFRTNTSANWQVTLSKQTFATSDINHGPGWHRPLGIKQKTKRPMNLKQWYPQDWPDPEAMWIWGSDPSITVPDDQLCWFRAKIWIDQTGTYRWFSTADDGYVVWIDGIEVASLSYDSTSPEAWKRMDEVDVDLNRGWHVFAMRGQNRTGGMTARGNPAAVIGTLMTLDENLKPDEPAGGRPSGIPLIDNSRKARTYNSGDSADEGWFANWAPPAWRAGDVLYTLVNEAKARGITRLENVTMDFTPELDSNGEEWTTRVSRTWDVGTSLLQVAFDLCELGVDIWMTADNVLHCAERRGSDDPSFAITYGVNISGYDTDETFTGASVAYTRTRTGWFTLENETSELILQGKRETGISLANTDSEDVLMGVSHRAIGAVVMANMAATAQAIIPRDADSSATPPVPGSIPYTDVNISDIIYVLSPDGSQRMGRLLSITVTENEAGASTWVPEIEIWNYPFGDGVDPSNPVNPSDPNVPFDPSTWVPAAEDWTRFIPPGAGSDYPRAITLAPVGQQGTVGEVTYSNNPDKNGASGSIGGKFPSDAGGGWDGNYYGSDRFTKPSPSPDGSMPTPLNSQEAQRPTPNSSNRKVPPNNERIVVQSTEPKVTAGYHLWVDNTGVSE